MADTVERVHCGSDHVSGGEGTGFRVRWITLRGSVRRVFGTDDGVLLDETGDVGVCAMLDRAIRLAIVAPWLCGSSSWLASRPLYNP